MAIRLCFTLLLLLAISVTAASPAAAQQPTAPAADTTGAFVYASFHQIPWSRVDSLVKLQRFRPALRDRAIQMGCYLDSNLLIHNTGNEYNVVIMTTYPSFRYIGPGAERAGCTEQAWREVVPDSTLRDALQKGNAWVFENTIHYDVIYWSPYPRRP